MMSAQLHNNLQQHFFGILGFPGRVGIACFKFNDNHPVAVECLVHGVCSWGACQNNKALETTLLVQCYQDIMLICHYSCNADLLSEMQ